MKKSMRKVCVTAVAVMILTFGVCTSAFAAEESVPAYISAAATSIDVVMTESITMEKAAGSVDVTISDLEIENNSDVGVVKVSGINVNTGDTGWTLVAGTSDFSKMEANAKKLSVLTGSHDFSNGAWNQGIEVNPNGTQTIAFTGKTGVVTSAVTNQKVAEFVCTLEYK